MYPVGSGCRSRLVPGVVVGGAGEPRRGVGIRFAQVERRGCLSAAKIELTSCRDALGRSDGSVRGPGGGPACGWRRRAPGGVIACRPAATSPRHGREPRRIGLSVLRVREDVCSIFAAGGGRSNTHQPQTWVPAPPCGPPRRKAGSRSPHPTCANRMPTPSKRRSETRGRAARSRFRRRLPPRRCDDGSPRRAHEPATGPDRIGTSTKHRRPRPQSTPRLRPRRRAAAGRGPAPPR